MNVPFYHIVYCPKVAPRLSIQTINQLLLLHFSVGLRTYVHNTKYQGGVTYSRNTIFSVPLGVDTL